MTGRDDVDLGTALRALRRQADLSQRELARRSGVPQPVLARIESGAVGNPAFRTVERLVRAAGGGMTVDAGPSRSPEPVPQETWRDERGRRYPAHLDPEVVTRPERWWGAWWTTTMIEDRWPLATVPAVTFERNRSVRDERRARAARGARAVIRGGRLRSAAGAVGGRTTGEWICTAELDDGTVVGELRAHEFDVAVDGAGIPQAAEVPRGTVVLDGIFVAVSWRRLGIGRRLFRRLRRDVAMSVVALTDHWLGDRFLEGCGFRPTRALPAPQWFVARHDGG